MLLRRFRHKLGNALGIPTSSTLSTLSTLSTHSTLSTLSTLSTHYPHSCPFVSIRVFYLRSLVVKEET